MTRKSPRRPDRFVACAAAMPRQYGLGNTAGLDDVGHTSFASYREVGRAMPGGDQAPQLRRLAVRTLLIC